MTAQPASILTVVDADVPDSALSVDELGSRIVGLSARLAAATCQWLLLVAQFDAREGCARFGLATTARWLAHHCGIAQRTAVEHVRVARALVSFPALATELSAGRLSYSQVRAISRVPEEGEHRVVDDLIQLAEHGTAAQLEVVTRGMRTVESNRRAEDGAIPEESLQHGWTNQSQWRLVARLHPERGAVVQRAVEQVARSEGLTPVDALVRMAEIALVAINDSDNPPRPLRGDERTAVAVHVRAADLVAHEQPANAEQPRSAERGRSVARLERGPGLSRTVLNRLLCSGRIRAVLHDDQGEPCDVGRSRRTVTERQFRVLLLRDRHCAHPGCTSRAGLQAHHIKHWINGGRTDLANLVLLCERHHHALHDGEFVIESFGRQTFRFFRADGRMLHDHVSPPTLAESVVPVEVSVAAGYEAPGPGWGGERLDRPWAISVLAQRRENAGRPLATCEAAEGELSRPTSR